ncbi:MAG TPA: hypothetical protein VMT43_00020 [Acidimicrobiales bacterium]|nr:hypothetical protein [Acidimicrobiales bacterium]
MYLFSRRGRLDGGHTNEALTWATTITEKVNQITGLEVGLWMQVYSPGFGTLAWSTFLPDVATLEAAGDKLNGDAGYVALADEGAKYISTGLDDTLLQIVHGEPDPDRAVEYVSVVQAVCSGGKIAEGIGVGVEIAQRAEAVTGLPTMFATNVTGPYGGVGWLTGYENVGAFEAAGQALNGDPSWVQLVDSRAGGVYQEDATLTQQLVYRRLA